MGGLTLPALPSWPQGIVPGIKVDKGLAPMANANEGETWCQGLDGLAGECAEYYKTGARFCKWRTTVNIAAGASNKAVFDAAYGLARYAAIAQNAGLAPIIEPEILLDGDHDIDTCLEVAERVWAETFKQMADQGVLFEGILLKPSMVTPGADKNRANPETVAAYTLKLLRRRVPPAVPGIMFLSGGQVRATGRQCLLVGHMDDCSPTSHTSPSLTPPA